ncbi:MAG TPA: peroxiredoxin-like family protein [Myxococcota bacterium]|nr:peroxiredoxin-like family protein [Myxococcota bacterium]
MKLIPRRPVPALDVETLGGARWSLASRRPERFTMVVFYRGFHCPVCRTYIGELDRLLAQFGERGVDVIALSTDTRERAEQTRSGWDLQNLELGFGLSIEDARGWGLFVSTSRGTTSAGVEEPERFNEPGLFLVRPDGTLYWSSVSSMPFARPHFREILQAIDFVVSKDYPARGEA